MRTLLLIALTLTAAGCAEKKDTTSAPGPDYLVHPLSFPVEDESCTPAKGADAFASQPLFLWDGAAASPAAAAFPGLSSAGGSLHGAFVRSTSYGADDRVAASCRPDDDGDLTCDTKHAVRTQVAKGKPLVLCRAGGDYDRGSAEMTGLTTVQTLEAAARFYRGVTGAKKLAPVDVRLLPREQTTLSTGVKSYVLTSTDNAAWSMQAVDGKKEPHFVVYPSSSEAVAKGEFGHAHLWEIPFVLTHEFGHHVFHLHAPAVTAELYGMTAETSRLTALDGTSAEATPSAAVVGLNEGVADLFAFISLGSPTKTFEGLPCFGANRDPRSATFAHGQEKAIDDRLLSRDREFATGCDALNYEDPHMIGATMAYVLDRMMTVALADSVDDGARADLRAALLVRFIETFDRRWTTARPATFADAIDTTARAAIEAIFGAREGGQLSAAQCGVVRTLMPALSRTFVGDASDYELKEGLYACAAP